MDRPPLAPARIRLVALGAAAGSLALDYVVRAILLSGHYNGTRLIPGFADLSYAENHGISFSLLWQHSGGGAAMLVVLQLVIIGVIAVAAWRATRLLPGLGLGLVIGGALANVIDRGLNGAVFDYLYLHLGHWPLFVCNTPDIAISAGVLCIMLDTLQLRRAQAHGA